jgi:hypothetical protein
MFYKFDRYWKMFFFMLAAWIVNGICGFEFTVVTLLSIMVLNKVFK